MKEMIKITHRQALKDIVIFLEKHCGLLFREEDIPGLEREIKTRCKLCGINDLKTYLKFISSGEGKHELEEFLSTVTVHETFFFRIPAHFKLLSSNILPEITKTNLGKKTLRIWSAGCSTGEETYSIAITLLENGNFNEWEIKIFGTDLSKASLDFAKRGIYQGRTLNTVPQHIVAKYFEKKRDGFRIKNEVRAMCSFLRHNLVQDAPPTTQFDIIFFRNVMIYFTKEITINVIKRFNQVLSKNGYLFLGPAETLWGISSEFYPHYMGDCFVYRKFSPPEKPDIFKKKIPKEPIRKKKIEKLVTSAKTGIQLPIAPEETTTGGLSSVSTATIRTSLNMVYDYIETGGYPEADVILNSLPQNEETLYLKCIVNLFWKKEDDFLENLKELLEKDPLHLEGRYINAIYLSDKGFIKDAIDELKKILFVEPDLILPRYLLFLLLEKHGLIQQALREGEILVKTIENGEARNFTRPLFSWNFSNREILEMSKNKLCQLR